MLRTSIHYFAAVVKHGSIRAAAEALHIAQSAVSRRLQALEHDLGAPLLERRPRGVALTEAGEILHNYVRSAAFEAERVRSEIEALRGLHRGHVRLCTVESHIVDFLPEIISEFRCAHPGIMFQVTTAGSDRVVQTIRNGEADIGICFNQETSPDFRCILQLKQNVLAVMAPKHPLAQAKRLSLKEVANWPVGLSMKWSGTRKLIDAASSNAGVSITPVLETNSIFLLHRLALSGQGIAFLVRSACKDSLSVGQLVGIPLTDALLTSAETKIITLPNRKLPVAAAAFLDKLTQALRAELSDEKNPSRRRKAR